MAANQVGKTTCAGKEIAMHATGVYPDWWDGRHEKKPGLYWVAGISNEVTRDVVQYELLGHDPFGDGAIPKNHIDDVKMGRGISGAVDFVRIRHISGGLSTIKFKSYEQGRKTFQGARVTGIWLDEEPEDTGIYSESYLRTASTHGFMLMTFTPLFGQTKTVDLFYPEPDSDNRALIQMTHEDAPHLINDTKRYEAFVQSIPEHEREARTKGIPFMGEGRIFRVPEEQVLETPFEVPPHFARIGGLDFGWTHPTAGAWLAWDRDADIIHVTDCYRAKQKTHILHAAALKARGDWIPWAWPHDGMVHDRQSGIPIAEAYRQQGLLLLPEHSQFATGGYGVEAGIMEMLGRLETGRLRVFSTCEEWFEEYRMFHRKDGKVVKIKDDLMAATRYGLMMLRYARTHNRVRMPLTVGMDYDPMGEARIH